jgi:hypothetical protein
MTAMAAVPITAPTPAERSIAGNRDGERFATVWAAVVVICLYDNLDGVGDEVVEEGEAAVAAAVAAAVVRALNDDLTGPKVAVNRAGGVGAAAWGLKICDPELG